MPPASLVVLGEHPLLPRDCLPGPPLFVFVFAQLPEAPLSATRRGDLDIAEIMKKAGGGK